MALKLLSISTTSLDGVDFTKIENNKVQNPWKENGNEDYKELQVNMATSPVNEINTFVQNIFVDESEEDVALWSDEGCASSDANSREVPREDNNIENFENEQQGNESSIWSDGQMPEVTDINIDSIPEENEESEWSTEHAENDFGIGTSEIAGSNAERSMENNNAVPTENTNSIRCNEANSVTDGNPEYSLDGYGNALEVNGVCSRNTVHSINTLDNALRRNDIMTQIPMDDYRNGECDESVVSEWTDDGATSGRTNENEIIYIDAGTKIEKIIENLGIIESDVAIPSRAHLLITTLRELTKELQSIINDRAQKIDELEMQCESQEVLIKSHQEENEFILERIDLAMKELENTISEQHKKIDQLDKHSMSQDIIVENHIKEKTKLIEKISELEKTLSLSNNDKDLLCEKLVSYEKKYLLNKKDKELLQEKVVHFEVALNRHTSDKELLLERIVNLEVELDDLMKIHKEEKELLLDRINNLEVSLHDAEMCSKKSCVLSHDLQKQVIPATKNKETGRVSYDPKILHRHAVGMETSHNGNNIYAYANTEAAINVIHNMLHKDKLTKLI